MNRQEIKEIAKQKAKILQQKKHDQRYQKVIARLFAEKLIEHNQIRPRKCFITLADVLWAAEIEPRILELLPAILIKRPSIIAVKNNLPQDIAQVLKGLRRGNPEATFRGISAENYLRWVARIGQSGKVPKVTKSFRFSENDLRRLKKITEQTGLSETEVICQGLATLEKETS